MVCTIQSSFILILEKIKITTIVKNSKELKDVSDIE
jgi:hypothetical protein